MNLGAQTKNISSQKKIVNPCNVTGSLHAADKNPVVLQLSIVIPTFNERENISPLLCSLDLALTDTPFEVIFVDDNLPDGTSDHIRQIAQKRKQLRVIQRINERGLSSACVEGVKASLAQHVLIMDADLQHDEKIIPELLAAVSSGTADVASGTRFGGNNSEVKGLSLHRLLLSYAANFLAKVISGQKLKDPMSGFFLFCREDFMKALPKMACSGYKVYFDFLCSSSSKLEVIEVRFHFRERQSGESKLDLGVLWEYLLLLGSKITLGIIPVRCIGFCAVGLTGVGVHFLLMLGLFHMAALAFITAQTVSTLIAMIWNYYWNNTLTYSQNRQRGTAFLKGLGTFILISTCGALVSILISDWLYKKSILWPIAVFAGIIYSSVWNYALSRWLVWKRKS